MKNNQDNSPMTAAEWEALCERCGRCCYEKYDYRDRIYYSNTPCQYLDKKTKLCRVYGQRSEMHPDCVRLTPELIEAGILPADCPYVRNVDNYPAPILRKKRNS